MLNLAILIIGVFVGVLAGVVISALCRAARDPFDRIDDCCNGNCGQGRSCPGRRVTK